MADDAASSHAEADAAERSLPAGIVEKVEAGLANEDGEAVRRLTADLLAPDIADLLMRLEPEQRPELVRLLGSDFDFAALTELDESVRVQIVEALPAETVARGVSDLDSDDAVYILEDLDSADRAEILARLPAAERVTIARGLEYPENSAGRRMQADFIAVPPFWSVGQTLDFMRGAEDLPEDFYELYAVDPGYHLAGTVALNRLLRAKREVKIADIMDADVFKVKAVDDQEEVARILQRYDLVTVPVVDDANRLVGILTFDDVVDVIQEEADEDIRRLAGVGDEEVSDSVWSIILGRSPWLLINLGTAFLASAVIGLFSSELQKMVALAVLMPVVASMGGNVATQTMTVVVRALATREITGSNTARVIGRELLVGLLLGMGFAAIIGTIAYAWFGIEDLGIVIGCAILINLLAATLGGSLVPLILHRLKADPAVASGTFVTTVTDITGFFSFLGLAALWFGRS
jgi:magnesium transporter